MPRGRASVAPPLATCPFNGSLHQAFTSGLCLVSVCVSLAGLFLRGLAILTWMAFVSGMVVKGSRLFPPNRQLGRMGV